MASNRNNEIRNYTRRNGEQVIELVTKREAFDAAFDGELNDMGNYHHDISTIFESVYIWDVNGKCYSADDAELPAKKDIVAIDNAEWGFVWVSNRASDKVVEDINAGYEVQIQYAIEDDENEAEMEAEKAAKEAEAEAEEIEALEAEIIAHQDANQAGKPVITDAAFDAKVSKVSMAETRFNADGWQAGDIVDVSLKGGAVPSMARHTEHAQNAPRMPLFDDLRLGGIDTQETLEDAHSGHLRANKRHSRNCADNATTPTTGGKTMTTHTYTLPLRPTYNPYWHGDCAGDWGLSEYIEDITEEEYEAWLKL